MLLDAGALGSILGLREQVVLRRDAVEPRFFLNIVGGADTLGAFEHDMLEIVGDTCVGTVLGASLYDHSAIDFRLGVILVQPNGHAVA